MDQPNLMGSMQGFGDLADDAHRAGGFQRAVGQHGGQVAALDQPHTHKQSAVDLPVVMDRDHMRGVQSRRGVGFPAESPLKVLVLRQIRGQDFDRDDPVGDGVVGTPYLAHPARAQQRHQPVAPKLHLIHRQPSPRSPGWMLPTNRRRAYESL